MPTIREPDDNQYKVEGLPEIKSTSLQDLVGSLIENSEELARILLDLNYQAQAPVNQSFEQCLRFFIVQLKKFQNGL